MAIKFLPLLVVFLGIVSACSTVLPAPTASFENIQAIRASKISPLALGEFTSGEELPKSRNTSLQIRADSLKPPSGGSFSNFLRQTFEAELNGAGYLSTNSEKVLSAELTQSDVSTFGEYSLGTLAARFSLQNNGEIVFEKELRVMDKWPSAFAGVIAITDASNHYTELYSRLVHLLVHDEDFLVAVR